MKRANRAKPSDDASTAHPPAEGARGGPGDSSQAPGTEVVAHQRLTIAAAGLIVLSAVAAYHNSFAGPFVYDDAGSIVVNQSIRRLWPIGQVLSPPRSGETVSGRPLLNLSLAVNYALGGLNVWGYHATNLLIHIAAALLLFGILRRTFLLPALRDRFGSAAAPLALASALVWTVHPLQTESVTYIVQRAESLVGFFYLLTLYCVIRGGATAGLPSSAGSTVGQAGHRPKVGRGTHELGFGSPQLWYIAAVLACLLGMACKEIMVTAPLIVLLYDRTFLAGSFAVAWRRRRGLYIGLAATWGLLGYLLFSTGLIGRQSELGAPDAWSYARSQPGVILHYLHLSVWPRPLCLDYAWPVASGFGEILPGAIAVALLLAATLWGLLRRKPYGFLGAWFLLILAPSSSIMPLGQLAFEHRMYLSLAAVAVLAVAGGYVLWDRMLRRPAGQGADQGGQSPFSPGMTFGGFGLRAAKKGTVPGGVVRWAGPVVVLAAALLTLGYATVLRNGDYRSALAVWQDTVDKRPGNPVAHNSLGIALTAAGKTDAAMEHYNRALRLKPDYAEAHNHLGLALAAIGRTDEAIQHYQEALRLKPDYAEAHNNLGFVLGTTGKIDDAIEHYNQTLRLMPDNADVRNNLGNALAAAGRIQESIECYQETLRLKPDYAEAHNNLGLVLAGTGRTDEAIQHFQEALQLKPDYSGAHYNLGMVLAGLGRTDEAIQRYQEALRLKPDYAEAHNNLGIALAGIGRTDEAIQHCQAALRLKPDYAEAHSNLGIALAKLSKIQEAIEHYQEALRLRADDAVAHNNLANVLAGLGRTDEAIEHYQKAVRLKPDFAEAHNNLGNVALATGRTEEAIEHYHEAVRLKPDYSGAHYNLGVALAGLARTDEAIGHFSRALQLQPDFAMAHHKLAGALAGAGRINEAIEHYNKSLELTPDSVEPLNNLAWLLATSEPAQGGDPARAVRLAQRVRELSGQENARCLDTLAAAYAAAGRFSDAALTAARAIELAASTGQTALARNIRLRLELYRAGQPYREVRRSLDRPNR